MKIDKPSKPIPANQIAEGRPNAAPRGKPSPQPDAPQPDGISVSLGSTATQLHAMANSMASTPAVANASKVAEIKQAIGDGRFKVNPEIVADRLIQTVRDLINAKA